MATWTVWAGPDPDSPTWTITASPHTPSSAPYWRTSPRTSPTESARARHQRHPCAPPPLPPCRPAFPRPTTTSRSAGACDDRPTAQPRTPVQTPARKGAAQAPRGFRSAEPSPQLPYRQRVDPARLTRISPYVLGPGRTGEP
ncbi:hypothetical protein AB0933_00260 [Streptomyces venezuelae]|uniref:hypothetical protein n=1 Tax=Streptomyces venezuelae TaxID=54571 RepID=UPI0034545737